MSAGILAGRSGAVVVAQRFGSALNLNLHFHALVLEGVYWSPNPLGRALFARAQPLTGQDVVQVTTRLHRRILRHLIRTGRLARTEPDQEEPDEPLLAELYAASVQGRVALGDRSGAGVERIGRRRGVRPLFIPGELCCDLDGFSLHAKVQIEGEDRSGLERLARYLTRPPIATARLSLSADGRVVYALRRHWKDGTAAFVFDPLDFIARLAALVPRPRSHLLTYHGVLAPAAEWRDWIVPAQPRPRGQQPPAQEARRPSRASWAELLKRVFEIDALICPHCGGKRSLIALLTDGCVVRRILEHLGLPSSPPSLAPARAPPMTLLAW